jgi:hypothetical protein
MLGRQVKPSKASVRSMRQIKSAAEHKFETSHNIEFSSTAILDKVPDCPRWGSVSVSVLVTNMLKLYEDKTI